MYGFITGLTLAKSICIFLFQDIIALFSFLVHHIDHFLKILFFIKYFVISVVFIRNTVIKLVSVRQIK